MENTKKWYESKTIWGVVTTVVGAGLSMAGIDVDPATQQAAIDHVQALIGGGVQLFGIVMTVWGRAKADTKLTK